MKQLITVDGEEVLVREDEARSHRAVIWAMLSLLANLLIADAIMPGGYIAVGDSESETPRQVEQQRQ